MNMYEIYIAIFSISLTAGLIIGHKLGKSESRLEYQRGYLDAVWYIYFAGIKSTIERITAKNNDDRSGSSK